MKKLLPLILLFSFSYSYATHWMSSIEEAQKLALGTNKLILVDFWASWCGPCKKMDRESWTDEEVKQLLDNFILVRINVSQDRRTPLKFGISSIPDVFILNGNGDEVFRYKNYMTKVQVLEMLQKYALNTSFMQNESINYYKHKSYNTAFLLGKKYLDFSLYLEDEVRGNFLDLGEKYLKESQKLLDSEQSNYAVVNQKIELLELASDLYEKNFDKVGRSLEKDFMETNILEPNRSLFYFINYCYSKSEENESAQEWLAKLKKLDNHEVFLRKSELLYAVN